MVSFWFPFSTTKHWVPAPKNWVPPILNNLNLGKEGTSGQMQRDPGSPLDGFCWETSILEDIIMGINVDLLFLSFGGRERYLGIYAHNLDDCCTGVVFANSSIEHKEEELP